MSNICEGKIAQETTDAVEYFAHSRRIAAAEAAANNNNTIQYTTESTTSFQSQYRPAEKMKNTRVNFGALTQSKGDENFQHSRRPSESHRSQCVKHRSHPQRDLPPRIPMQPHSPVPENQMAHLELHVNVNILLAIHCTQTHIHTHTQSHHGHAGRCEIKREQGGGGFEVARGSRIQTTHRHMHTRFTITTTGAIRNSSPIKRDFCVVSVVVVAHCSVCFSLNVM